MPAWLLILADGSNTMVGYTEAIQGVSMLVTALPIGYVADRMGKAPVIKIGGVLNFLAVGLTAYTIINPQHWSPDVQFWVLCGAMVLWGIVTGILSGPLQALFADSIPTGKRTFW